MARNLGMVTAYAYAVAGGYTGTEAEFEELLGNIADDLSQIENLSVTVTTLTPGSSATASYSNGVLALGIPRGNTGATGETGATPNFTIGAVETLEPGESATASITGTAEAPVLNLGIPEGQAGSGAVGTVASAYSASKTYAVGDYVIHNSNLYRCTTAITTAEAFTAAHWTQVVLGGDVSDLKSNLKQVGSYPEIEISPAITYNKAISANGSIVSGAGATFGVTDKINVDEFDNFVVTTTMGWGNLLYAFYGEGDVFISGEASSSSGYTTITNKTVEIPPSATTFRVAVSNNPYSIKGDAPYTLGIQDDVDKLISAVPTKTEYTELAFDNVPQKYINASGEFVDASGDTYYISDFVDISAYDAIYITASANWSNRLYAFYDSNKDAVLVGTASGNVGTFTTLEKEKVAVPSDATYIVVAGRTTSLMPAVDVFNRYVPLGKWYGKKWVCVGDSLTEKNAATTKHYYDYVSGTTDITPVIMGVSGSGYARKADQNQAFYQRISSCPTDADVVTIFGSFNDLGAGLPIGTVDDNNTTTLAGCINTTIDNLQTIIPLVNLGIVAPTPWDTTQPSTSGNAYNYVEMLKAICERRSIPFLDLWRSSNLRPWDADFRSIAYSHDGGSGTHPDENGHKLIAPRFEAFLDTLLLH